MNEITNGLTVKDVDLFGDTIVAAQDKDGIIWAGIRWMCEGLGLSEGQIKYERKKIKEDLLLCKGRRNFILPTSGGNQETLCLQLDYVPIWLAKISITPKMKESNPELVEKLVNYQLKAKDVLAAAFLPETYNNEVREKHGQEPSEGTPSGNTYPGCTYRPSALDFHGTPVITTSEIAKHYRVSSQNVLTAFYRNKEYFKQGVHYFILEADEEPEFRAANGLNTITKIYLWTRKGSLMFTKIINNEIGWKQYNEILDILFQKTYGDASGGCSMEKTETGETEQPARVSENVSSTENSGNEHQLKLQESWYLKNAYKIERVCKALDIETKEFNHLVIAKIQERYDMEHIGEMYKKKNGKSPEYALNIISCFPELSEIADNVLSEFMLSVIDRFSLIRSMAYGK